MRLIGLMGPIGCSEKTKRPELLIPVFFWALRLGTYALVKFPVRMQLVQSLTVLTVPFSEILTF